MLQSEVITLLTGWNATCVNKYIDDLSSVVLACLGFLSPANRGALMTCAVVLWVLLGTPAGYVSARLYKSKIHIFKEVLNYWRF